MKFTPRTDQHYAEHEYKMYTCLDAINNSKVEAFGIPAVYYYGQWKGHTLMAITLLDTEPPNHQLNEADILILFLEFVCRLLTKLRSLNWYIILRYLLFMFHSR